MRGWQHGTNKRKYSPHPTCHADREEIWCEWKQWNRGLFMRFTRTQTDALMEKVSSELIISRNDYFFLRSHSQAHVSHTFTRTCVQWDCWKPEFIERRTNNQLVAGDDSQQANERVSEQVKCDKNRMKLRTIRASFITHTHLQTMRTI